MKKTIFFAGAAVLVACSPIPDLLFAIQAAPNADMGDMTLVRRPTDFGPRPTMDLAGGPPCPIPFSATASFCYYPGAADPLNLETVLELSPVATGCDLSKNVLSVSSAGVTCTAAFQKSVSSTWNFSPTKPVFLSFSYSLKQPPNTASLSVNMPVGSMNEVFKIGAIAGPQNLVNLYIPAGTMFDPGMSLSLGGMAKKASISLDWILVWQ